jgi:hypothetical protein
MSDYSFIANNPQGNPINNLNGMMTLANGMQDYKRGNIELQKSQETMQSDIAQSKATSQTEQEQAQQQHLATIQQQGLNGAQEALSLYGQGKTPDAVRQHITDYMNNAGAKPDAIQQAVSNVPNNPAQINQYLVDSVRKTVGALAQLNSKFPAPAMQDNGGTIQPIAQGNKALTGVAPGTPQGPEIDKTISPGQNESLANDAAGNPVGVTRAPSGVITGVKPISGVNSAPTFNPSNQTLDSRQKQVEQNNNMNFAASKIPQSRGNNKTLIKLADTTDTGEASQLAAKVGGGYVGLSGITDYGSRIQQMGHLLAVETANNHSVMSSTDAGNQIKEQISGTTDWTPQAFKSNIKLNDAMQAGDQIFNNSNQASIKKTGNPFATQDNLTTWNKILGSDGVTVLRVIAAQQRGDSKEIADIRKQEGDKGWASIKSKLQQIHSAETTGF